MGNKALKSLKIRFSIVASFFNFLLKNKMWWMIPMIVLLLAFFVIIILGHSTPLGPFIYTIF
jgi:hypothetical protein